MQDVSSLVFDVEVENQHGEGPSNTKRKETLPKFYATEIPVHISPSPFCCIIDLRNIILPGIHSDQTFFS